MKPSRPFRMALLLSIAASCAFGAVGMRFPTRLRGPDSEAKPVRPYYTWELSLERTSRAAVGPIEALHSLKLRLDPEGDAVSLTEPIVACVEQHCKTLNPAPTTILSSDPDEPDPATDPSVSPATEFDLSDLLTKDVRDGGREKLSLTLQRELPGPRELLSLSVKVETDRTSELPEFTEVRMR